MKLARTALLLSVSVAIAIGGFVGTASAATVPANDHIAHAVVISTLPYNQTLDTTRATTDATDAAVNGTCGAPATNNSVWYKFTGAHTNRPLVVDTTGSTFSSGVIIATGTPGKLTTLACAPVSVVIATKANTAYWILAFDDTGNGGTLHISIHGAGPKPANDKIDGAKVVSSLPFSQTLDVTGATTDSVDTQANGSCGAPSVGHSVWYKFTAGANDSSVVFDASLSNYAAGVLVATGSAGALSTVTCGPFSVTAPVTPGTTYYVMVFDFSGGPGGTLKFTADDAPTLAATVRYRTLLNSDGSVQMRGSYTCTHSGANAFLDVSGQLVEVVGHGVVTGTFDTAGITPTCDGTKHQWSAPGFPDSGQFVPGKAAALTFDLLCNTSTCVTINQNVAVNFVSSLGTSTATGAVTSSRTTIASAHKTWGTATRTQAKWGH
jgi:hypothetical protein